MEQTLQNESVLMNRGSGSPCSKSGPCLESHLPYAERTILAGEVSRSGSTLFPSLFQQISPRTQLHPLIPVCSIRHSEATTIVYWHTHRISIRMTCTLKEPLAFTERNFRNTLSLRMGLSRPVVQTQTLTAESLEELLHICERGRQAGGFEEWQHLRGVEVLLKVHLGNHAHHCRVLLQLFHKTLQWVAGYRSQGYEYRCQRIRTTGCRVHGTGDKHTCHSMDSELPTSCRSVVICIGEDTQMDGSGLTFPHG